MICEYECFKPQFALSQWLRKDGFPSCRECVKKKADAGTPFECTNCRFWKSAEAFYEDDLNDRKQRRVCRDCIEERVCHVCNKAKPKAEFTHGEWLDALKTKTKQGSCKQCMQRNRERKSCSECAAFKEEHEFSKNMWKNARHSVSANSVCRETERQNLATSARHSRRSISFPSVCGDCRQRSESALLAQGNAAILAHGHALLVKNRCPEKNTVNGWGEGKAANAMTVCNAATCVWRKRERKRNSSPEKMSCSKPADSKMIR